MKNHPEDEAPPSLSLGVSRCRSPLSGSDLSSRSTKERWSELETKVVNVFDVVALMLVMKRKLLLVAVASSKATEVDSGDDDEAITRPPGVKAAKARSKKTMSDGKELSEFQTM
ncbi:hypothetical protein F2Q70_00028758 [Brassica cretica]|uniref:Uncharacterized protein n=1 Tax=Brassica cretica TaxID=69181 RepID=A0A8S9LEJ1_BRACR|nr:hypothetical protein F2Q70_00028758 [Brassica cretica]